MSSTPLIEVDDLRTWFHTRQGIAKAVDGVSFALAAGEILGIAGESGSGKSVTGLSILGLVDPPGRIVSGRIAYRGRDLIGLEPEALRRLRGDRIAMVFQDPMMTLNPVLRVDTQMIEALQAHAAIGRAQARERACEALHKVGIPAPAERLRSYPHQLSGGMRQRVAIAIAMLNRPDLIVADEPTTALDVTIQAQILHEVRALCRDSGAALLWITHDLAVLAGLADRIAVMYAGRIVEAGPVDAVLTHPLHPYTRGLIASVPSRNRRGTRLAQIAGMAPRLTELPRGCAFRPRCERASEACGAEIPRSTPAPGRELRCIHPLE
ncbi:MAG: ATP-binding cassette domain-containing protein [Betaproteobacteria bacterium]|nr:ATP-binding cassette domain-containing protein [Betaproteobacteria bacterium]